jgi:hypothetical protein
MERPVSESPRTNVVPHGERFLVKMHETPMSIFRSLDESVSMDNESD